MKKFVLSFFTVFGFLFIALSASAAEYVFTIDPSTPSLMSLDESESALDSVTVVNSEHGLCTADNLETVEALLQSGVITEYEPIIYYTLFDYTPSDKYYSYQETFLSMIHAQFAWNKSDFGSGVKIAVIDSGLKNSSVEFSSAYVTRAYDYINPEYSSSSSQYCNDTYGHGTSVSGIIGAAHNAYGIAGLSPQSSLYVFKTFTVVNGVSQASNADIAAAIYNAVDNYDCDIINMSLGGSNSSVVYAAIKHAYENDVLLVAAAGNDGSNSGSTVYYPAAYDEVICVGSVDSTGHRASHSQRNDYVDIMAPGSSVYSVTLDSSGYGTVSGTSFAAPHVTAALALAKSLNPDLSAEELTELLFQSADEMSDRYSGNGLLNIQAFLTLVRSTLDENTLFYSSYDDGSYVYAVTPSDGYSAIFAQYDDEGILTSASSDCFGTISSDDLNSSRLFIWQFDTLLPAEFEIGKSEY
ncbi:MAG: S8 family serine peptidase [Clostridia bacterium]|nr:S8 family serine peptidase [Clostridia bacterium]